MYEDLLPHTLPTEAERLDQMAHAHDPDTFSTINRLNLPAKANCLDIGAGRGSVAIWLAETFPDAKVIASDLDVSSVKENALSNLSVKEIDLRSDELGSDLYDLIHCRSVLCFLPTRTEVLSKILQALKPGGAFVATEMDFGRIASGPSRFWATFWTAYLEFAAAQGWELGFGGTLPRLLVKTGYTEVDARHIQPILNMSGQTAGSAEAETWSLTLATLAPQLIGGGFMSKAMLSEALSIIRNPEAWTAGPGFMVTSARRPVT
ncbi:class I SAM-dependent methyltransferase [Ruegeria lacuscaerulensis]|uniref:class I SAM-dependent methyltransferase n=1 Tax=Ruegeria lacuscaerulensis TaxID=55218 RepID=UPI0014818C70|nr:class I SAM-dependent methyltransferase [Ruegeria lacuscaerulensis]